MLLSYFFLTFTYSVSYWGSYNYHYFLVYFAFFLYFFRHYVLTKQPPMPQPHLRYSKIGRFFSHTYLGRPFCRSGVLSALQTCRNQYWHTC